MSRSLITAGQRHLNLVSVLPAASRWLPQLLESDCAVSVAEAIGTRTRLFQNRT